MQPILEKICTVKSGGNIYDIAVESPMTYFESSMNKSIPKGIPPMKYDETSVNKDIGSILKLFTNTKSAAIYESANEATSEKRIQKKVLKGFFIPNTRVTMKNTATAAIIDTIDITSYSWICRPKRVIYSHMVFAPG
jgi:hypothetical protein